MSQHWPLFGLTLRTPRLELRLPSDDELSVMIDRVLERRIHDEDVIPFLSRWALASDEELPASFLQFHWAQRAGWSPSSWNWVALAFVADEPVGCQSLGAVDFGAVRSVNTGSWLLSDLQGQGLGTHMRAAVLTLAFDALGALEARSSARVGNDASLGVSYRLGYEDNGRARTSFGGQVADDRRLRLTRERWEGHRPDIDVHVLGLDRCRQSFGASD